MAKKEIVVGIKVNTDAVEEAFNKLSEYSSESEANKDHVERLLVSGTKIYDTTDQRIDVVELKDEEGNVLHRQRIYKLTITPSNILKQVIEEIGGLDKGTK